VILKTIYYCEYFTEQKFKFCCWESFVVLCLFNSRQYW